MMKLTKTDKLTIEKILGWKPGKEMLLMILGDMKSGMSATEAASKYTMPEMFILDDDELPPEVDPDLVIPTVIVKGVNHKSNKK